MITLDCGVAVYVGGIKMQLSLIELQDIPLMSRFLHKEFGHRNYQFWCDSLSSIYSVNSSYSEFGALGYCAKKDDEVYAAILVIHSREKDAVSLSSWAVIESSRHMAYPFIRAVIQNLEGQTIYNHSAVAGVDKLMETLGFKPYQKAIVPLPVPSLDSLKYLYGCDFSDYEDNIKTIQSEAGLLLRVKLLSVTRNNRFRRLALLVYSNRPISKVELAGCALFLLTKGLCFVCPQPSFALPSIGLNRFVTMVKNIEKNESLLELVFSGSEYEVMEF